MGLASEYFMAFQQGSALPTHYLGELSTGPDRQGQPDGLPYAAHLLVASFVAKAVSKERRSLTWVRWP